MREKIETICMFNILLTLSIRQAHPNTNISVTINELSVCSKKAVCAVKLKSLA